jgi:hypothetical protein
MAATEDGSTEDADGPAWLDEHRFAVIVEVPAVQAAISAGAAQAVLPQSAEEFLSTSFAVMGTVLPNAARGGRRGAARGRAFALRRGVRTGKSREEEVPAPIGQVIASALWSLARHGLALQSIEQHDDGCHLIATIPSTSKVFGGELRVAVVRGEGAATAVLAHAEIPGQLYDWGVSRKTLAALFADLPVVPGVTEAG